MADSNETPTPPSTIVECIPAVRTDEGELLTTADHHAAYAARVRAAADATAHVPEADEAAERPDPAEHPDEVTP